MSESKSRDQFDANAYLAGIQVREEWVEVFPLDLSDEIEAADTAAQVAVALKAEAKGAAKTKYGKEAAEYAAEAQRLREQMQAMALRVLIRPMDPDTFREFLRGIATKVAETGKDNDFRADQLAMQVAEIKIGEHTTTFTADQWREFGKKAGAGPFNRIYAAADELTQYRAALPDFSQATSDVLAGKTS